MDYESERPDPKWQPINANCRRVLGVLIEKAKTTPDVYPMSLNGITTACNQKSNRAPKMELSQEDVEDALDDLRELGAVGEIQSVSRVAKYKHYAYAWLGVEKIEAAVMAELLLRGEQTLGELRGRAARMEPIKDLGELKPIVSELVNRGLIVELTPAGRGQVITHGLYDPGKLDKIRERVGASAPPPETTAPAAPQPSGPASHPPAPATAPTSAAQVPAVTKDMFNELQVEVAQLKIEVARLRDRLEQLES